MPSSTDTDQGSGDWLIRRGTLDDLAELQSLFRCASLANPDDRDDLTSRPDLLTLSDEALREGRCRVAVDGDAIVGFSSYLVAGDTVELDDLFVVPSRWRRGVGRALVRDVVSLARASHRTRIEVTANPQARAFYERTGFVFDREVATELGRAERLHLDV
jgi:GNAT superfamily N-acetyltransferase